jgi:hypothetical protein
MTARSTKQEVTTGSTRGSPPGSRGVGEGTGTVPAVGFPAVATGGAVPAGPGAAVGHPPPMGQRTGSSSGVPQSAEGSGAEYGEGGVTGGALRSMSTVAAYPERATSAAAADARAAGR